MKKEKIVCSGWRGGQAYLTFRDLKMNICFVPIDDII